MVRNIQLKHSGKYVCMVHTEVDTVSAAADLIVRGMPVSPYPTLFVILHHSPQSSLCPVFQENAYVYFFRLRYMFQLLNKGCQAKIFDKFNMTLYILLKA